MKRFILLIMAVVTLPTLGMAETIILNSPHEITPSTALGLEWKVETLNSESSQLVVKYRWRGAGSRILMDVGSDNKGWNTWNCVNTPVPGENSECVAEGDPYDCCSGEGTGTCDDMLDTCFSDIFGFEIRSQDVGTPLGQGLRTLIYNAWRDDVIPGNDGTFQ